MIVVSQRRRPRLSQRTSRKRVPGNDSISEEESADEESNLYLKKDSMDGAERREVIQTNLQRVREKDRHEVTATILSELADQLSAATPSVREKNRLLQTQNGDKKGIEQVYV
mgnify:FL=1